LDNKELKQLKPQFQITELLKSQMVKSSTLNSVAKIFNEIAKILFVVFYLVGIFWFGGRYFDFFAQLRFDPTIFVFGGITVALSFAMGKLLTLMASHNEKKETTQNEKQTQRNRKSMLELMKKIWVEDFLQNSLHKEVLIRLGLGERKKIVERPWDMVLQIKGQPDRILSPDTKIIDVFDEMQQSMLILGEPGSGKTTLLLELAQDAIGRAEKDRGQPIPVLFNLSSWHPSKQSLVEWLVNELNTKYFIPQEVAQFWVESDDLALLLDGLDEVALENRETCVAAINVFCQDHSVPLAICSRTIEYEILHTKLKLHGSVLIQPLNTKQVNHYLTKVSPQLEALRINLKNIPPLQELSTSPLILNIMILAYQEISIDEISNPNLIEAQRAHLLNAYIQKMLKQRDTNKLYSSAQVISWLKWLAQRMLQNRQIIFFIEDIHPDYLQTQNQQRLYHFFLVLIGWLIFGLIFGLSGGLIIGLIFGLSVGLIVVRIADRGGLSNEMETAEVVKFSEGIVKENLKLGLIFGLILGVGFWLFFDLLLVFGLIFGLSVGLMLGLIRNLDELEVRRIPTQTIRPLMKKPVMIESIITTGEIDIRVIPNRSIRLSMKRTMFITLILGLIVGLSLGLIQASNIGLIFGLIFGLIAGLLGGGIKVIQHFTLRFILATKDYIPWNLVRFLDYAAEHIFLRKVGGGYIFIHRLLMEHFANLETEQINSILKETG